MERFFLFQGLALTPLISVASFAPVILYAVARWRAHREPVNDPQLGIKFLLHYFAVLGFHLALAGGTLLIYTMIKPGGEDSDSSSKSELYRIAFGMLVPAGMVLGAHLGLIRRTNEAQFPGVRKLFVGFNLMITGLAGFAALIVGFQALFYSGSTHGVGHFGGAAILVYCTAWGLLVWRYDSLVIGPLDPYANLGGPPGNVVTPPAPPTPAPPAATTSGGSGGGLPPLGGGSYPPLDPPK